MSNKYEILKDGVNNNIYTYQKQINSLNYILNSIKDFNNNELKIKIKGKKNIYCYGGILMDKYKENIYCDKEILVKIIDGLIKERKENIDKCIDELIEINLRERGLK